MTHEKRGCVGNASRRVLCTVLFAEIVYRRDLDLRLCLEFAEDTIARERGKRDVLFC
jgi:hypothetical protein